MFDKSILININIKLEIALSVNIEAILIKICNPYWKKHYESLSILINLLSFIIDHDQYCIIIASTMSFKLYTTLLYTI